jgi:hypothetical protein
MRFARLVAKPVSEPHTYLPLPLTIKETLMQRGFCQRWSCWPLRREFPKSFVREEIHYERQHYLIGNVQVIIPSGECLHIDRSLV